MKKSGIIVCTILFLWIVSFPASGAPAHDGGAVFADLEGKEWILSEFINAGKTVRMDRQKLLADNLGGVFTIRFSDGQVNGMGAPNRYFGPYTAGANRSLVMGNLASTMMMAFREPDELKESEYFGFLRTVTRWDQRDGKLELHGHRTEGSGVTETILIFIPN